MARYHGMSGVELSSLTNMERIDQPVYKLNFKGKHSYHKIPDMRQR